MNQYFTRVELRGEPPVSVYTSLHSKMASAGFSQIVVGANGRNPLPHAVYVTSSNETVEAIDNTAYAIGRSVWAKGCYCLTIHSINWAGHLEPLA